jgi:ATP-dependent DNA ligase
LLLRRDWPCFYAFDLQQVEGQDVRAWPLLECKQRLRRIMPKIESRLFYLDHVVERGRDLDRAAAGVISRASWANGQTERIKQTAVVRVG